MIKFISWFYPLFISIIVVVISIRFDFSYTVENFDKVLDGTITFSSIVVGFLGALLGILVSIKDSAIVKSIFDSKEKHTLKRYFNETFIMGFLVVILSCAMHVLRVYPSITTKVIFYIWLGLTCWFIPSTHRIVNILMSVFFKTNSKDKNERPESNKVIEVNKRQSMKERLKK
ncbi:hypothetical protein [Peribacillus aracenensis]|uniref:hypothetical protein n=1 Tax=Peribacillus aracenensis TaxID=2976708 RepID=UPI0021A6E166|nr:hypothetical protein [Peribacillus sp. BBB004]